LAGLKFETGIIKLDPYDADFTRDFDALLFALEVNDRVTVAL